MVGNSREKGKIQPKVWSTTTSLDDWDIEQWSKAGCVFPEQDEQDELLIPLSL
jgi:hypothetical protein